MKKFMVVCISEGKQWAKFFDSQDEAEQYRMNCVCGVGGDAEVYKRQAETDDEAGAYEFLYS